MCRKKGDDHIHGRDDSETVYCTVLHFSFVCRGQSYCSGDGFCSGEACEKLLCVQTGQQAMP